MSGLLEQFLSKTLAWSPGHLVEKVNLNIKVLPKMMILTEPGDGDADDVLNSLSKISRFMHFPPGLPESI